jgi:hypothetical protein
MKFGINLWCEMGFPTRLARCLERNNILTIPQLHALSDAELMLLPGISAGYVIFIRRSIPPPPP